MTSYLFLFYSCLDYEKLTDFVKYFGKQIRSITVQKLQWIEYIPVYRHCIDQQYSDLYDVRVKKSENECVVSWTYKDCRQLDHSQLVTIDTPDLFDNHCSRYSVWSCIENVLIEY